MEDFTRPLTLDHNYTFPSSIETAKRKCDDLRNELNRSIEESKLKCDKLQRLIDRQSEKLKRQSKELKRQKRQISYDKARLNKSDATLQHVLELLHNEKQLSSNSLATLGGRFSDAQLQIVKGLLGKKGKGNRFTSEAKDFAITLHYYSPKGAVTFRFCIKIVQLFHWSHRRTFLDLVSEFIMGAPRSLFLVMSQCGGLILLHMESMKISFIIKFKKLHYILKSP